MEVKQIYPIVNAATSEYLGDTVVLQEDLGNIVEVGKELQNLNTPADILFGKMLDQIGRMVYVNRTYKGRAPKVLMDGWEYGALKAKIRAELPEASENEAWELQDGTSYDPHIFYGSNISAKYFNKYVTFEIDQSITDDQLWGAFASAEQMNGFVSMLLNQVENSLTVKNDALIMRTINNMMAETIYNEFPGASYTASSGVRAVNLLYLYNQTVSTPITASEAWNSPEFWRFASNIWRNYTDRLAVMSNLFNINGTSKFTPADRLQGVMLSEAKRAIETYLYDANGQFSTEYLKFPEVDTTVFWQGSGLDYANSSTSKLDVITSEGHTVTLTGVVGCMFDREALGVCNMRRRVDTQYNAKANFTNYFYKVFTEYFNDFDENMVVFFIQ